MSERKKENFEFFILLKIDFEAKEENKITVSEFL